MAKIMYVMFGIGVIRFTTVGDIVRHYFLNLFFSETIHVKY